ncbi:hypothetical protein [Rufibacter soli]
MNLLTLNLTDNIKIEVDNTYSGVETVKYNGEVVSEKRSLAGENHLFERDENGETVHYEVRISIKRLSRIGIDIYRDNKMILMC